MPYPKSQAEARRVQRGLGFTASSTRPPAPAKRRTPPRWGVAAKVTELGTEVERLFHNLTRSWVAPLIFGFS